MVDLDKFSTLLHRIGSSSLNTFDLSTTLSTGGHEIGEPQVGIEVVKDQGGSVRLGYMEGAEEGVIDVVAAMRRNHLQEFCRGLTEERGGGGVDGGGCRDMEASQEGFQGRVGIHEGGEEMGAILEVRSKGKEEDGEDCECEEVGGEACGGLFQELVV